MGLLDDFEIDGDYVKGAKTGLHIVQIILGFVVFVLEIIVFHADNSAIVGNNGWTFAVVFLSIPAWIYLIMTPRFDRTRDKFAEPHALLTVDALFTVFWLSAFASQAAYNTANLCGDACSESKGIVGIGIINTLLWAGTTFLSLYCLQYYNLNGSLPGYDKTRLSGGDNIDPDKAAFSMAPHDEEAYAPVQMDDQEGHGPDDHARYGGPVSPGYNDDPERYGNRAGATSPYAAPEQAYGRPPAAAHYSPPSAQDAYDEERPAQFPVGNYDRSLD